MCFVKVFRLGKDCFHFFAIGNQSTEGDSYFCIQTVVAGLESWRR